MILLFISIMFTIVSLVAQSGGKGIESAIFLAASGIVVAMYYKKP